MTTSLFSCRIQEEIPDDFSTANYGQINYEINREDIKVDIKKAIAKVNPETEQIHIKQEFDADENLENIIQEDSDNVNDTTKLYQHITVPTEFKSEFLNLEHVATKSKLTECEGHNDVSPSNKSDHSKCLCMPIDSSNSKFQAHIPCSLKVHKCNKCEFMTHHLGTYRRHLKTHNNFSCKICEYKTVDSNCLKRHMKHHNRERTTPFECNTCDYTTLYTYNMRKHLKTHAPYLAVCTICGRRFSNIQVMKRHVKHLHDDSY